MELAKHTELVDTSGKSRQKRSRTGCLTCRTRRRKCDEGKPRCRTCASKGLECEYPAAFQILGKNNFTPKVSNEAEGRYTELQFVPEHKDENTSKNIGDDEQEENHEETPGPDLESAEQPCASPKEDLVIDNLQRNQLQSPSTERYEFALHGLLALGSAHVGETGDLGVDYDTVVFPESENFNHFQQEPNVISISESQGSPRLQSWPSTSGVAPINKPQTTDECTLEYFRHYRYKIAPWMDICDLNGCFGCEVLQLSSGIPAIHRKVVAVAHASMDPHYQIHDANASSLASMQPQEHDSSDTVQRALVTTLESVKAVVANLSGFWNHHDTVWCTQNVLEPLLLEMNGEQNFSGSIAPAVFWLMARLQLSIALLSPSTVHTPLPATYILALEYMSAEKSENVFQYAHTAVALCINATIFSRGDEDRWLQKQYGLNRVELWETLVAGFDRWYKYRPQDFQSIIELYPRDGISSEDGFPTMVFSSGAAVLANQLYHTGMILLLQNKPRFVNRPYSQSSSMSTLWHVHRTCGISLSNDRWDNWDPSLIASLLVAAKSVTHESQHKAILGTLENVQRITGWNIGYHVEQLALEWQQVNER